ncbi:glycerol-3-phosphate dehydrogenase, partial [Trifolium medium]|nr:glycerol-3-phosphate dehydrogenase [Trifolium medium]
MENSQFIIGDGTTISFWTDCWCSDHSFAQSLHIPVQVLHHLNSKVSDYIQGNHWHLPPDVEAIFPNLRQILEQVTIPLKQKPDSLAWKEEIWLLCDRNWQAQCKVVILACLINILSTIWMVRNQARFKNKSIHWKSAVTIINSSVSLSGNLSKKTYHASMRDFSILKKFKVSVHPPRAPTITEVLWHPPPLDWLKCNTDGASNNTSSA